MRFNRNIWFVLMLMTTIIFAMAMINIVSAQQIGTFNQNYDLKKSCTNNGSDCSGSATCNITINYPDGTNLVKNARMTNQISFHNYTIPGANLTQLEYYTCHMVCNDNGLYGSEDFEFQVTGNGKPSPAGGVITLFVIVFVILVSLTCYLAIYSIGHLMSLDFDLIDLAFDWGLYFAILAFYFLEKSYLGDVGVENYLGWFIAIGGILLVVVPMIAFLFSITIGSLSKKRVQAMNAPPRMKLRRAR